MSHGKSADINLDELTKFLMLVSDLLYAGDYARGVDWALELIRPETRQALGVGAVVLKRVGGAVRGSTTNGGLVIELTGDRWDGENMDVSTTNGGIIMSVPENYSAHLQTGMVNGSANVEFPVTVQGRITKQIALDLGSGGALVRAMTTNGGVHLKRVSAND